MKVRTVPSQLFDTPGAPVLRRHAGTSVALCVSDRADVCPTCAWTLVLVEVAQPALFYLHGFGGTTVERVLWCGRCGYHRHHATRTVSPR